MCVCLCVCERERERERKREREREKERERFFFIKECQLTNVQGRIDLENYHLAVLHIIIDSR